MKALAEIGNTDARHPAELPHFVQEWFRGTRPVFFKDTTIKGSQDLRFAAQQSTMADVSQMKELGIVGLLGPLMDEQYAFLQSRTPTKKDDLDYNRLCGEAIETICPVALLKIPTSSLNLPVKGRENTCYE
jgi:hypothetical protein